MCYQRDAGSTVATRPKPETCLIIRSVAVNVACCKRWMHEEAIDAIHRIKILHVNLSAHLLEGSDGLALVDPRLVRPQFGCNIWWYNERRALRVLDPISHLLGL